MIAWLALCVSLPLQTATFDPRTGVYEVSDPGTGWHLSGKIDGPASQVRERDGRDEGGNFHEISFTWGGNRCVIQSYAGKPAFRFRLEYLSASAKPVPFPSFTDFPSGLRTFSYRDSTFAPGTFSLAQTSTPWLLFDDQNRAFIFSPASQFMVAKMVGDGKASLGASLNDRLAGVPKGLQQDSVLVLGQGINDTWDAWGGFMRSLYKRPAATPDSDVIVKNFGYWTDNGADYYYNYDPARGYADTLVALTDRYRTNKIPMRYLQLDSWWYRKLYDGISGEKSPELKNPKFPAQDWNRYGGVLEYRASPDLFPKGLKDFSERIGLPFVVHGRWIDQQSPWRSRYKVSGVAPVDPKYWSDTANYLAASGVTCYEQDWLDHIYDHSPEMPTTVGVADAFIDGMANAMRGKHITMQYCMPTPRFILQGVKYPNLTTVRTASDRFEPRKWAQFLLGSPFVQSIGAYPWCDVFRSKETGNLTLAVLSAGPVGTGDAMGMEQKENILRAALPNGEIVKPDHALVPTDSTYHNETEKNGKPFLASTFTDHGGYRTDYYFAFPREQDSTTFALSTGHRRCFFDFETGTGVVVSGGDTLLFTTGKTGYSYVMSTPATKTGIYFLGDLGKIVPTGKQRISSIRDTAEGLRVAVRYAKGEGPVMLDGYYEKALNVKVLKGVVRLMRNDQDTKRFSLEVTPALDGKAEIVIDGRPLNSTSHSM